MPNLIRQNLDDILKADSFTHKITFGRTNYSKEVNAYECHRQFCNEKGKQVIAFCVEHHIAYHVKEKTMTDVS
ncbi:MAG: hypothetical protein IJ719_13970 [Clostridia bacterium]|nr:hypothetical protein [Clostridia bacterium]